MNYRPTTWEQYFGQKNIIDNLKIFVQATKIREKPLDHLMISGPSGMGKTSLAYLLAKVLKAKILILNGPSLQKASDIISVLSAVKENNLLFIDEIHAINKEVSEVLYPVLEENKMNIIIGKDLNSKNISIPLPSFTLIGATTEIDKLSTPFINRFPIFFQMENYLESEIELIVTQIFKLEAIEINKLAVEIIAAFARTTPRTAINLSKRIIDFHLCEKILKPIEASDVKKYLGQMNLFHDGLTKNDLLYLKILNDSKALGIETISQISGMSLNYLINFIEPHLLRKEYIIRTPKGRKITLKGEEGYKKISNT